MDLAVPAGAVGTDPSSMIKVRGDAIVASTSPPAPQTTNVSTKQSSNIDALEEVTVTATRRNATLQDVPYNISVATAEEIANSGATTINDLTRVVTGLTTVDQGPSARAQTNNLTLRGLRTESPGAGQQEAALPNQSVNAVSTYFGETPIFFPMVLADVERVEVLRGPQGTLYGSGAEAGTIRFIPRRPSFEETQAEISVTGSWTENAPKANENIRGLLNVRLSDNLALRLVGGEEHMAGFIDAVNRWVSEPDGTPRPSIPGDLSSGPVIGPRQRGVNSSKQGFARAALRWKANEKIDIELGFMHQQTTQADVQEVSPNWPGGCVDISTPPAGVQIPCAGAPKSAFYANAGDRYTNAGFFAQPYRDSVNLGSLVGTFDFDFATLTSASSYYTDDSLTTGDATYQAVNVGGQFFAGIPPYNGYPRANNLAYVPSDDKSFVQEIRLASNGSNRFDYLIGAYYQKLTRDIAYTQFERGIADYNTQIGQQNPSPLGDETLSYQRNTDFRDKAIFGELTAHFTNQWQATLGIRLYDQSYATRFKLGNPFCGAFCSEDLTDPAGVTAGGSTQTFKGHLPKVNTSYDITPNLKVYATYSEGFRRGGANAVPVAGPFASLTQYQTFEPDRSKNYEIGLKGSGLDHRIRYSAALYRIDLTQFQFNGFSSSGVPATFNGTTAQSKGAELELSAAATRDLTVSLGYAYTQAKTTSAVRLEDLVPYALIPAFGGTGVTETAPLYNLPSGARLPGVPAHTVNLGVDYAVPSVLKLPTLWTLRLHADAAYRSAATGNIDVTSIYYWQVPSSTTANTRATLDAGAHTSIDLFANNVTNATAYSGAAYTQTVANPYGFRNVTRPRTIGLTLRYKW